MGAIFGFTGSSDIKLQQCMEETLGHRGHSACYSNSLNATVGYLGRFKKEIQQKLGTGIYTENDQTIAICGYLTSSCVSLSELLAQYRNQGISFVDNLSGAFIIAIIDREKLYLVRDGAGVRTVYYGYCNNRLYFAIEPKAILAIPEFPRRLRPVAVAEYFSFSFIPGERTMLEDLYELPAGHILYYDGQKTSTKRYFYFEDLEGRIENSEEYWVERCRQLIKQEVKRRFFTNDAMGIFLSGGLDSSLITAEVCKEYPGPVKAYAIHFGEKYPHELEFARKVVDRCQVDYEEVLIRPKDFLPRLRKIIWHLDEPIGDPITVPNFELAAYAAREVRWIFNGEGGDPCFGGPKNLMMMLHHWYGVNRQDRFRERCYLESYRRGYEELKYLLSPEWREKIDFNSDLESILTPFFTCEKPTLLLNKLMAINIRLKGAHLILPKVERMLGASGLTPLSPLFSEELIRLSFALPPTLKLAGGVEKVILKRAYKNQLPQEIINRPKSGMRVPVHFWMRSEMKRYARKILHRKTVKSVGIFDDKRVQQLLNYDTQEGPGRYGIRLWMLITFEIWRRLVIDREPL